MFKNVFIIAVIVYVVYANPTPRATNRGCHACHPVDPNKVNVHLIPHSHDDVGWLKTVDQYFWGSSRYITRAGVQYIISSVVEALKASPDRRYIQVETAFFWKWWQYQSDKIREDVIKLVNDGQLEFINAAWSMNDEATTNYQSTIDQFTYGLKVINETVGSCATPSIGWQIDPFGHSREQASIFAQLGYDAVFFARISEDDRNSRRATKNMEVLWKGSANVDHTDIFTSVFPEFYYPPWDYCFDVECGDETINDDIESADYNIPRKVNDFGSYMESLVSFYQTNNVLIPMGGDFMYHSAEKNFANMDKLIKAFEGNSRVNVIYSTPSCYLQAVYDEATTKKVEFTQKTDDFFPYASDNHAYWTGYFTSRPSLKRFERISNNILQASKQLATFSQIQGKDISTSLRDLQQALGILQHHDAITGTSKRAVAKDYASLLNKAVKKAETSVGAVILDLLAKSSPSVDLNLQSCLLANVSLCDTTKASSFVVVLYNPLERAVSHYVRVPVPDATYRIQGEDVFDVVNTISNFGYVVGSPHPKELVFVSNLPGFGTRLYHVERTSTTGVQTTSTSRTRFGTTATGFEIDDSTGLLKSVTINGRTLQITQEFFYYVGVAGYNYYDDDRASGAYVFRPRDNVATAVGDTVTVTTVTGKLVDEVHQVFNERISQIIRVYKGPNDNYIEFDWLVGPLNTGHEIISRYTVKDFDSAQTFYTDSNGRELIKRQLNKRSDFDYDTNAEPVASNYYPVTSKIVIRDEVKKLEVAVLNDRAQGGSSLQNGAVELMVHRTCSNDDGMGVGEALEDTEYGQGLVARGKHYLVFGPTDSTPAVERDLALKKLLEPLTMFADASALNLQTIQNSLNFQFEALKSTLPDNVHILTLEPWSKDSYLLRLEHILEKNEDANLSKSVTVNLKGLFTLFDITEIAETTLGANHILEDFAADKGYVWNIKGGGQTTNRPYAPVSTTTLEVSLDPMEIRSFIIKVSKAQD